jgi:hypothetical protein
MAWSSWEEWWTLKTWFRTWDLSKKLMFRSSGKVSISEENSCTAKVYCHMWVEGYCSLQLYGTVLCWIFCYFTTLHFISMLCILTMHIMTYATFYQISALNVTKIQCIYVLNVAGLPEIFLMLKGNLLKILVSE